MGNIRKFLAGKPQKHITKVIGIVISVLLYAYFFYLTYEYKDITYGIIGFGFVVLSLVLIFGDMVFGSKSLKIFSDKIVLPGEMQTSTADLSLSGDLKNNRLLYLGVITLFIILIMGTNTYFMVVLMPFSENVTKYSLPQAFFTVFYQNINTLWIYIFYPLIVAYIVGLVLFIFNIRKQEKAVRIINIIKYSAIIFILFIPVYFISTIASIYVSNLLAVLETKSLSTQLTDNNSLIKLGIISDPQQIKQKLQSASKRPSIIGGGNNPNSRILSYIIARKNRSQFYQKYIFQKIVDSSKTNTNVNASIILLPDNALVINKIDRDAINTISPALGYLMVKSYFDPKYIKASPGIEILGRQEYLKFRDDEINKQLAKIDGFIAEAKKSMDYYAGSISTDRSKITTNQNGYNQAMGSKDNEYNKCMSAGYYGVYTGSYYRYYSDSYCENLRAGYEQIAAGFQKNIKDWQYQLGQDQYSYKSYKDVYDYLSGYREMVATQKDQTIRELGIFLPPTTIKLVLENTSESAIADFLATIVHEYLHYSSYVSEERALPGFFEEGLTEYFARQIIADQVKTKTNIGYPLLAKILDRIAKDIPRQSLEEIYFNKDENSLISSLNGKYGDKFYNDSKYYFEIMGYLGDTEALTVANDIIYRIGGEQLTVDDMYSTESSFSGTTSQ